MDANSSNRLLIKAVKKAINYLVQQKVIRVYFKGYNSPFIFKLYTASIFITFIAYGCSAISYQLVMYYKY